MPDAIVIGNSHVEAFGRAKARFPDRFCELQTVRIDDSRNPTHCDLKLPNTRKGLSFLRNCETGVPVYLSLMGTHHNSIALFRSNPPMRVLDSQDVTTNDGVSQIVPSRLVKAWLKSTIQSQDYRVRTFGDAVRGPLVLMGAPPPKQSNAFLEERVAHRLARRGPESSVGARQIADNSLRKNIWKLEQLLIEQYAKDKGFEFLPAPEETLNDDGFLQRRLYARDTTHANFEYGVIVLREILKHANKLQKVMADG